jgi:hypothetical protein
MRNFVAIVFDDARKAYEGLHALWQLDDGADITVHGTGVVHRDGLGYVQPGRPAQPSARLEEPVSARQPAARSG